MCLPDIKAVYVNTRVIAYIFNKQVVGRHYTFCSDFCTVGFRTRAQMIVKKNYIYIFKNLNYLQFVLYDFYFFIIYFKWETPSNQINHRLKYIVHKTFLNFTEFYIGVIFYLTFGKNSTLSLDTPTPINTPLIAGCSLYITKNVNIVCAHFITEQYIPVY